MQPIMMTEMLRATAKFEPNGRPKDPKRVHITTLREQKKLEKQRQKPAAARYPVWTKLTNVFATFGFERRKHSEVS